MKFIKRTHLPFYIFILAFITQLTINAQYKTYNLDSLLSITQSYTQPKGIDTSYAWIQYEVSLALSNKSEYLEAIKHAKIAFKSSMPESKLSCRINNSLGSYYLDIQDYVSSLQHFQKALKTAIFLNDPSLKGIIHYNLYIHYETTKNFDLAYDHLNKGYDLMIATEDTLKLVQLLNSMGQLEQIQGNLEQANVKLNQALEISIISKNDYLISTSYNNAAKLQLAQKDTLKAITYLKKSFEIDIKSGKDADKAIVSYNIASIYRIINQSDSAIFYYNLAKGYAKDANKLTYLEQINISLFKLYYQEGVYDTLPQIFKDYQLITDSILSKENLNKYAEAKNEIELMTNQQELELIQVNQKSNRQRLILISLLAVLLVLMLIGSTLARNSLQKQKKIAEALYQKSKNQKSKIEKQKELLEISNKTLKSNALGKDRIMSLLAHDLRTPFSSIHSLNHLVKVNGSLTEKQLKYVDTSDKVVVGGLDLISDILDIYKLEHLDKFELDPINISLLLKHSIDKMTPITTVREQTIILDFEDDIEFEMNREMLQSAVDNLLSNASKYSESGKTIRVHANKDSDLIIKICDDGQGFSEQERDNIFERFNKFTRSTISTEPSTGLGLFLVKGFVEKLNGSISVKTKAGKGSTFTMVFKPLNN